MVSLATGVAAIGALAAGCGGGSTGNTSPIGGPGGADGGVVGPITPTSGAYEPLAIGASWTYHVDDKGVIYDKTSTVETLEDAGGPKAGTMAFRLRDTFPAQAQLTWYQVDGDVVKRLHEMALDSTGATKSEDWYDPYRLRIDATAEHTVAGASYTNTFTDTHSSRSKPTVAQPHNDTWKVDGVDEPVAVPAGNFAALHVTHTDSSDGSTKDYWFVRGVGKVKEATSGGHTEALTSYHQP